jgi:hypothetical protein
MLSGLVGHGRMLKRTVATNPFLYGAGGGASTIFG